jgi:hypothetical protein
VENFPQVPHPKTRDLAAKVAGFQNPRTYEQAKKVVLSGTPELTAAMDKGEVSVSAAAKLATKPPGEQRRILAMPKNERRTTLAKIRKNELNDEEARDLITHRTFYDAVRLIADFHEDPKEAWAGLWRACAIDFNIGLLDRALEVLTRLRKADPNESPPRLARSPRFAIPIRTSPAFRSERRRISAALRR